MRQDTFQSLRPAYRLAFLALIGLVLCGPAVERAEAQVNSRQGADRRSVVVLRHECSSELGRREVTLFANGTIRLREKVGDEAKIMKLAELGPEELDAFLRRIDQVNMEEVDEISDTVDGGWIEECRLEVRQEGESAQGFSFGRYIGLSLPLSHLVSISQELGEIADKRLVGGALPKGYKPRPGDILERLDGTHWEIIAFTGDKQGLEMEGVREPLTLYVAIGDVPNEFARVVSRRTW